MFTEVHAHSSMSSVPHMHMCLWTHKHTGKGREIQCLGSLAGETKVPKGDPNISGRLIAALEKGERGCGAQHKSISSPAGREVGDLGGPLVTAWPLLSSSHPPTRSHLATALGWAEELGSPRLGEPDVYIRAGCALRDQAIKAPRAQQRGLEGARQPQAHSV